MIHSLAGGNIRDLKIYDFAKVEFVEGENIGKISWYINPFWQLKLGDLVLVPFGPRENLIKAKVLKIEHNVNEQVAPIPTKKAKEIFKIIEN